MPSGLVKHSGWLCLKRAPLVLALFSFAALAETVVEVRIEGYQFRPAEVSIKAGDSVRWTNHEKRTSHSVVFPAEGGLESERMFPDESWQRRFDKPGRYAYHCGPHPEMTGVVLVTE
ncbi:plastocyanin/azurin family copper-binding protein [Ferribacterium limneticum]|uniref:plastocyanin/azurin family copper-binding protein n=1 Tax=Ferribacterium limneticum TaxID=76259 RepID=UPI001CFA6B0F|nr:plastocyanin/azurin family copper-binding protein [Ferribacterium limneticum]UCV20248.1 cupredoxin domain-containing protein [Ferribacterium limneticum]